MMTNTERKLSYLKSRLEGAGLMVTGILFTGYYLHIQGVALNLQQGADQIGNALSAPVESSFYAGGRQVWLVRVEAL